MRTSQYTWTACFSLTCLILWYLLCSLRNCTKSWCFSKWTLCASKCVLAACDIPLSTSAHCVCLVMRVTCRLSTRGAHNYVILVRLQKEGHVLGHAGNTRWILSCMTETHYSLMVIIRTNSCAIKERCGLSAPCCVPCDYHSKQRLCHWRTELHLGAEQCDVSHTVSTVAVAATTTALLQQTPLYVR